MIQFVTEITVYTLLTLNLFEWITMWSIIESQRNRDVNEILYDFNTEVVTDEMCSINFRKNEIKLKKLMLVFYIVVVIYLMVVSAFFYIK